MSQRARLSALLARQVEHALHDLRYGTVQLVVHDAQVVRIERTERIRLTGTPEAATAHDGRPTGTPEARHATDTER